MKKNIVRLGALTLISLSLVSVISCKTNLGTTTSTVTTLTDSALTTASTQTETSTLTTLTDSTTTTSISAITSTSSTTDSTTVINSYVNAVNYLNDGKTLKVPYDSINKIDFPAIDGYTLEGIYTSSDYKTRMKASDVIDNAIIYFNWEKNNFYEPLSVKADISSYIDSLMNQTSSFIPAWNKESFKDKWNYIDGVFLKSIIDLYKSTSNSKYKDFVHTYVNYYINSDGDFIKPTTEEVIILPTELDSICESQILFDLDSWYGNTDDRYKKAIENTYNLLSQNNLCTNNINYEHKASYPSQIWLDGMYMYGPFLARYALYKNDLSLLDDLKNQYEYIYNNMKDSTGLYLHAMDTSKSIFWADLETGLSKNVWLRSTGWLIVSLTDVVEYYPEGSNKEFLKTMLEEAIDAISKYINPTSMMYYQLPKLMAGTYYVSSSYLSNLGNTKYMIDDTYYDMYISNYLESSGSSMIAYSMMKSARLGFIDNKYYQMGYKTFEGVYENSFNANTNELKDICITAGLGPSNRLYRDSSAAYYLAEKVGSNDAKGVGPFIMAFLEYNKE